MRTPTLVVSPTRPYAYRQIGMAVTAAAHGAVIIVEPGHYDGQVVVRAKAVTIRAAVPGGPPVVVEYRDAAPAVFCEDAHVTLQGLTLRTWSADAPATVSTVRATMTLESCTITGQAVNAVTIERGEAYLRSCHLHGMRRGVAFIDSNGTVEHCRLWDFDEYAVLTKRDSNPTMRHCHVQDVGQGFEAFEGGRGTVEDCQFAGARQAAVVASGRSRLAVHRCQITAGPGSGMAFSGSAGGLIEDCHMADLDGCGVEVSSGAEPDVRRCQIERVGRNGIFVSGSRGIFSDCTVTTSRLPAVAAIDGAAPQVRGGVLRGAYDDAVLIREASGQYANLEIESPGRYGVRVQGGNPTFTDLTVTDGEAGIVLDGASEADVRIVGATIRAASRSGIAAGGTGRLTGTEIRVEDAPAGVVGADTISIRLTDSTVSGGTVGVVGAGQASLLLERSAVTGTAGPGVVLREHSQLDLRASTLRDCGGDGVQVETDAPVLIDEGTFVNIAGETVRGADRPLVSIVAVEEPANPDQPNVPHTSGGADGTVLGGDPDRADADRPSGDARSPGSNADVEAALAELDAMIGLDAVKSDVRTLVHLIRVGEQRRRA